MFPQTSIKTLISFFKREAGVTWLDAAEAAQALVTFGLQLARGQQGNLAPMALEHEGQPILKLTNAALIYKLETFAQSVPEGNLFHPQAFALPPWLLPLLAQILQRVLTQT